MTKRNLVVESTQHNCARLLKYYPRPPCAPSFVKSRMLRPLQTHFLLFNKYSLFLYVYNRGLLGCLLRFWPLGQNPAGGNEFEKLFQLTNRYLLVLRAGNRRRSHFRFYDGFICQPIQQAGPQTLLPFRPPFFLRDISDVT